MILPLAETRVIGPPLGPPAAGPDHQPWRDPDLLVLPGTAEAPSSQACGRVPDRVRIEGSERPAGQRGTSSSGNVTQSFGYRAPGTALDISCSRTGTPLGGCIPAG
jgi:hypothetical protein